MGTDGNCSASTNPFSITPTSTGFDMSVKPPSFSSSYSSSDAGSDELGSDCDSPDSWEEKLRRYRIAAFYSVMLILIPLLFFFSL